MKNWGERERALTKSNCAWLGSIQDGVGPQPTMRITKPQLHDGAQLMIDSETEHPVATLDILSDHVDDK